MISIKSEQRKGNRFIMMTNDYSSLIQSQFTNADSGKRVRVWKDIRQEASLGYQDVKRRDKRSLMDRIKEFFADIKDFSENI